MAVYTIDWDAMPPGDCCGGAVTIGNFDGVHRGHAALLSELRRHAVAHASAFTWEQCAADSLRVYREIAAGRYDCAPTEDKRQAA